MTSTIRAQARSDIGLFELSVALFPRGSVTGAPKVQATEIIGEVAARGAYTGTIGFISACQQKDDRSPDDRHLAGMQAMFSVAIRTVVVDRKAWSSYRRGRRRYHLGLGGSRGIRRVSGQESLPTCATSGVRQWLCGRTHDGDFELFETLLFEPGTGYYLVERHLQRLVASARYFGSLCDVAAVREQMEGIEAGGHRPLRGRLMPPRQMPST